ncbi:hypothetical protein SLUN_02935 [Streptomyces lunaelactis]|uniref:Uncharacterized protein n=1 Tax=Streptomyces lunaelactis TaxID=1535768 RepID=A0A2R4SWV6_9ACTN|nr:hypothetical protein SLUN_02935 [Streptomyces lunaelactis]
MGCSPRHGRPPCHSRSPGARSAVGTERLLRAAARAARGRDHRDYVGAFFDLHLRGIAQPLLNGPSAANPEVTPHNGS